MHSFIEVAGNAVAILKSGLPLLEAFPVLMQLKPLHAALFGKADWPDDSLQHHFQVLSKEREDHLVRTYFLKVLNNWLIDPTRLGPPRLFDRVMDCYMALNNMLMSEMLMSANASDRAAYMDIDIMTAKTGVLLNAYADVVDAGFIDIGGDPFAKREVEFAGIFTTSHARLIVKLAARALERVFKLVCDEPVPFHEFQPWLSLNELPKLRKLNGEAIATAAAGDELTVSGLDHIRDRFVNEYEISKAPVTDTTTSEKREQKIDMVDNGVSISGVLVALTDKQYALVQLLLGFAGEYISLAEHGYRSRDIESLPEPVKIVIDSQPGAGTRIHPQWLN